MTLISKGSVSALKVYLLLMLLTAVVAVLYLLYTIITLLFAAEYPMGYPIGAFIGLVFILASFICLNSAMFVKTMAFYLHNRVWRRQLKLQQLPKRK